MRCSHYEWDVRGAPGCDETFFTGLNEERGPLVDSLVEWPSPCVRTWLNGRGISYLVVAPGWKRNALFSFTTYQRVENKQNNTKSPRRSAKPRYFRPREEAGQRISIDKSVSINEINEDAPFPVITGLLRGYFNNRFYSIVNLSLSNRHHNHCNT